MKVQICQCVFCKKYDEELDENGVCVECEDKMAEVDHDIDQIEYERYMAAMKEEEEEDYEDHDHYDAFDWNPYAVFCEDDNWYDDMEERVVEAEHLALA
ncbi:hypothetical protein D3C81_519920 [compost metagenome]